MTVKKLYIDLITIAIINNNQIYVISNYLLYFRYINNVLTILTFQDYKMYFLVQDAG